MNDKIVVIGSTNFPESLDKAVIRPGRFDKTIHIPEPTYDSRIKLIIYYLSKLKLKIKDINVATIASLTGGFTGADIKNLVNTAAMNVVAQQRGIIDQSEMNQAFERMQMGLKRNKGISEPVDLLRTAYHESGHALTSLMTEGAMKLNKITILPVGQALGFTGFLPDPHEVYLTSRNLRAMLDTLMGGRAAEEVVFGNDEITSGCGNDLEKATSISVNSVLTGIFEEQSLAAFKYKDLSEKRKFEVDSKVQNLMFESLSRTKNLLVKNKQALDLLARKLLEKDTLTDDEVKLLLKMT